MQRPTVPEKLEHSEFAKAEGRDVKVCNCMARSTAQGDRILKNLDFSLRIGREP